MRNQRFTWDDYNNKFKSLVTEGPAFQFGMSDMARIRIEIGTLIYKLSKHYLRMKDQEKVNKKRSNGSDSNKRDSTSSCDLSVTEGSSNKSDDKKDDRKEKGVEQNKSQSILSMKDQERVNRKRSNDLDRNKRDSQHRRKSKRLFDASKKNESELTQKAFARRNGGEAEQEKKKTQSMMRKSRDDARALMSKLKQTSAGSRLIKKNEEGDEGGENWRTCLPDAIMSIVNENADKDRLSSNMRAAMPSTGDTCIGNLYKAMQKEGLALELVNSTYMSKKGGAPYHLFQERSCKIIIGLKLTLLDGDELAHFVGWDGAKIHDSPYVCLINTRDGDRATPLGAKLAFGKLYPRTEYKKWHVTNVYKLVEAREVKGIKGYNGNI